MDEHGQRLESLRPRLRGDVLYVSEMSNIRYLTGFTGSAGHLLVTPDTAILVTDGRYRTQAAEQTSGIEVRISPGNAEPALAEAVGRLNLRRLRFEANRISFRAYRYLRSNVRRCRLLPLQGAVEKLREIKSPPEIEAIRRSLALNSRAFERACALMEPGWTEARLAAEVEYQFRLLGAQGAAFPTIVAGGPHGARPHAEPRDRALARGSLVVVDQGAILDGYCSDMTRMISVGRPSTRQQRLVRALREAQEAAIDAIRPGVECQAVDSVAREVLRRTTVNRVRLDRKFTHSTGHGLGLEIHEAPGLAPGNERRLEAGMVVTVEPGAYLEGWAGARLEDVVVVTDSGCEVLTDTPRRLRMLGGSETACDG